MAVLPKAVLPALAGVRSKPEAPAGLFKLSLKKFHA